ncbi:hypothetical protein QR721_06615 [Aciduricibacillus chroicocephali]|uniref:Uncharacterized protein n=1 Tax=Aciduricibacillus chroicocephali TaxID=3054939 RepID=A0ABY9KYD6_9BACI|nr:hypothetical protein QR721_06615 [Bacillaceae bacterium 44XB]
MEKVNNSYKIQFKTTDIEGATLHHLVYEFEMHSAEELLALSLTEGRYTKFKRTTDKQWYTFRTFAKRLSERQLSEKAFNEFNKFDRIEEYETSVK